MIFAFSGSSAILKQFCKNNDIDAGLVKKLLIWLLTDIIIYWYDYSFQDKQSLALSKAYRTLVQQSQVAWSWMIIHDSSYANAYYKGKCRIEYLCDRFSSFWLAIGTLCHAKTYTWRLTSFYHVNMTFSQSWFAWVVVETAKARLAKVKVTSSKGSKDAKDDPVKQAVETHMRSIFKALAVFLGDKPFFFGDSPTSLDAFVFGHIAMFSTPHLKDPFMFTALSFDYPELLAFINRMKPLVAAHSFPLIKPPSLWNLSIFSRDSFRWNGESSKNMVMRDIQGWGQVALAISFFIAYVWRNKLITIESTQQDDDDAMDIEDWRCYDRWQRPDYSIRGFCNLLERFSSRSLTK